jgi:hypothetical protein
MLQQFPPTSDGDLGARVLEVQQPPIIHSSSFHLPSGSLWSRLYWNYEDSERVQGLLTAGKAIAFILRESEWPRAQVEVEAVLYFRNPTCFPLLGDVCCIGVRRQDVPALVRLVKQTQGLDPMSAEQWKLRVRF